jgi:hypothetical protein
MFEVLDIDENASDSLEWMGSKPKFWFWLPRDNAQYLYKEARPNTGEDWSEKAACELCVLLGLPHAHYELASFKGRRGVASRNFVTIPPELRYVFDQADSWGEFVWGESAFFDVPKLSLVHGNEMLFWLVEGYEREPVRKHRTPQHTLDLVLKALEDYSVKLPLEWQAPRGINTAVETFIGYLMLDAWIGNTDRHHENWAVIELKSPSANETTKYLAPSYDHASSLGFHLTDEERLRRLATADKGYTVEAYAGKARSAFFRNQSDKKPMLTAEVFAAAATRRPAAARAWLERLAHVESEQMDTLFDRFPPTHITAPARAFARRLLAYNRLRLLDLRSDL